MVAPVTSYTTYYGYPVDRAGSFYGMKSGNRQKPPFDLVLGYTHRKSWTNAASLRGTTTSFGGMADASATKSGLSGGGNPQPFNLYPDYNPRVDRSRVVASNKAYDRFRSELRDVESLMAVTWAEREQALQMIIRRGTQLRSFVRAFRSGRIPRSWTVARQVRSRRKPGWRERSRNWGDRWLEYHFGWSPLVSDIHGAVEILQKPFPEKRVKVRSGRVPFDFSDVVTAGGTRIAQSFEGYASVECGGYVKMTNPLLYKANALGLANPATVVWELIPFSFLVDWFVNVGDFLAQGTDFIGLEITRPHTTTVISVTDHVYETAAQPPYPYAGIYVRGGCFAITRGTALPGVTLTRHRWKPLSFQRALTAVSLLLQQLR